MPTETVQGQPDLGSGNMKKGRDMIMKKVWKSLLNITRLLVDRVMARKAKIYSGPDHFGHSGIEYMTSEGLGLPRVYDIRR